MEKPFGLSEQEVTEKRKEGKSHTCPPSSSKTVGEIVRDNLLTYFNIVHLFLFICVISVGQYKNGLFIVIIAVNAVIGIVQELRAKKIVDRLSSLTASHARVIREGTEKTVEEQELVEGDTVRFGRGDRIGADARVVSGCVDVNESLLTGESDDVRKTEGERLLSGSFVTGGEAYAVLETVGADCFAYSLAAEAKKMRRASSGILRALGLVMKVMGILIIPVGLILFFHQLDTGSGLTGATVGTVASVVGMIPSGLYLLTSIALTVGVINLGKKNALVRQMYAVEALARTDMLCLDKTGTLTSGNMTLSTVIPLGDADTGAVMATFLSAFGDESPTLRALKASFCDRPRETVLASVAFTSDRRYSGVVTDTASYAIGACDALLDRDHYSSVYARAEKLYASGQRVLVLVRCGTLSETCVSDVEPLALLGLEDSLRENVKETVAFFENNNVSIRVISGDSAAAVSAVALRAGITGAERFVDLAGIDDALLPSLASEAVVFGRVSPSQKKILIDALKRDGHTVAMTGDGVNDVLAMKESDCSIAMASGSEMACQIADLVLTENDWTAMKGIVMEGRRVVNNIERSASLFFVKTMFSLVLSLAVVFLPYAYPFESIHMTLVSCLTVGLPGFLLALEPNETIVRKGFLKNVLARSVPSALAVILCVLAVMTGGVFVPEAEIPTAATLMTLVIGFMTLGLCCVPASRWRILVFLLCAVLATGAVMAFPGLFSLLPLGSAAVKAVLLLSAFSVPFIFIGRYLIEQMRK